MNKTVVCAAVTLSSVCVFGAFERTVPATDGVGDVVALTNAIAELNALSDSDTLNSRIYLQPGLYDLRGIHMTAESHLDIQHARNLVFAGLGNGPEDTVLLGGGREEGCRVIKVGGGGNYWWNTYSNITVTGGYTSGNGGGICSGSLATLYVRCIISNNVSTSTARYSGGGGCCFGVAEKCLFADNTAGICGGALEPHANSKMSLDNPLREAYATDCIFSNNQITASYNDNYGGGAVTGGTYTRCKFYDNKSASRGGAVGRSENCKNAVLIKCEFYSNSAATRGGAVHEAVAITNCTFVANSLTGVDAYGGAIYARSTVTMPDVYGCVFSENTAENGCVAYNANLTHCIVTNNIGSRALYNVNLTRCLVVDNCSSTGNIVFDSVSENNSRTNVNCVFVRNRQSGYGSLSEAKVIVNCAYLDNWYGNGNYSPLFSKNSLVYNSVFSGNKINNGPLCDIRTSGLNWSEDYPTLVNCIFSTTDGAVDGAGHYTNCYQVPRDKLKYTRRDSEHPLTPSRTSKMFDNGYESDWLLALVGDTDYYGRARRLFDRIDIGPAECGEEPLGLMLLFR